MCGTGCHLLREIGFFFFIKTYIHKLLLQICVMYILPNKPITQTIFLDSSRTTLF